MPCPSFQENKCSLFRHELHPHQEMSPQDRASFGQDKPPAHGLHIRHQTPTIKSMYKTCKEKEVEPQTVQTARESTLTWTGLTNL